MGMKLGDLCDVLIACAGHFTISESQQWQFFVSLLVLPS